MKIGIIGPSEEEINPFIECLSNVKVERFARLSFHEGLYNNIEVVALYCGVCKVNAAIAAQVLVDRFNVTHIIVIGVAGAINRQLQIGDTVISTEVAYHDVEDGILTEYHPWMDSIYFKSDAQLIKIGEKVVQNHLFKQRILFGKVVTGEAFISDEGREAIITKYNPLCVDMESASIAHVCYANRIPFIAIRSITDTEDEPGQEVFEENCVSASINSIEVVKKILEAM